MHIVERGFVLKKISLLILSFFFVPGIATAESAPGELYLSIRRIGLEISRTQIQNAAEYADSPVQALSADSQDFIKGVFDTVLEYKKDKLHWDNGLFMEYGKTTLKPYDEPSTSNENADKILFSSDMSWACWEFGGFKFGPTVRGAYDTEFVANGDVPRQNIVRASGGLSLFEHPIIKSLYLTGLYEYDFTYSDNKTNKTGAEFGWRFEYELRPGIKFQSNGYYREYFSFSGYVPTDLKRDLSAVARMDTKLWGDFYFGPYIQYRLAKARGVDVYGGNLIYGLSFNYVMKFGLITPHPDDSDDV